jgi:hypothetical protein
MLSRDRVTIGGDWIDNRITAIFDIQRVTTLYSSLLHKHPLLSTVKYSLAVAR